MDFEPTEEQRMALDGWKRAVERDIAPMARRFHDRHGDLAQELGYD